MFGPKVVYLLIICGVDVEKSPSTKKLLITLEQHIIEKRKPISKKWFEFFDVFIRKNHVT
jgi:hypothetical protein